MFKNKKGNDGDTFISTNTTYYYIFALFLVILSIGIYIAIAGNFANAYAPVPEHIEADLAVSRLTNLCFAYTDGEALYQNVIDFEKVTQRNLEDCFEKGKKPLLRITLRSFDERFLTKQLQLGLSNFKERTVYYVLVKLPDQEEFIPAQFEVQS